MIWVLRGIVQIPNLDQLGNQVYEILIMLSNVPYLSDKEFPNNFTWTWAFYCLVTWDLKSIFYPNTSIAYPTSIFS